MNDKFKLTIITFMFAATLQAQIIEPVPFDKKWHIGAGAVAGVWGTFAGNSLDLSPEDAALFGISAAVIAGIGKECIDIAPIVLGRKDVRFDPMDIAATTMGGIIGSGLSYAALKIFKKKPPVIYTATGKGFEIGVKIRL